MMSRRILITVIAFIIVTLLPTGCGGGNEDLYGIWTGHAPASVQSTLSDTITYTFHEDGNLLITYAQFTLQCTFYNIDGNTIRFEGTDYDWQVRGDTLTLQSQTETLTLDRVLELTPTP